MYSTTNTDKNKKANVLYRSRIEICRVLRDLAMDSCNVLAELGDEKLFVTKILKVDEQNGHLFLEYGAEKSLNSILFEQRSLKFGANYKGAYVVFKVSGQHDAMLGDKPAIRFFLPVSLIWAETWSQRRQEMRRSIPMKIALRCMIKKSDGDFFETYIVDISHDGMGGMISNEVTIFKVGSVLKDCRIYFPGHDPVIVDLVVRNSKIMTKPDGTQYGRVGLRFIQRPEEITELIKLFIYDLEGR